MDTCTLVTEQLDAGQKLVQQLGQNGFEVTAAFWFQASDDGRWYFYIVSPLVEREGLAKAYQHLHSLIRQTPQRLWIDPLEVRLIGPSDRMAQDVLAAYRAVPGPLTSPLRWRGIRLGNVSIEAAYLYPLPADVTP